MSTRAASQEDPGGVIAERVFEPARPDLVAAVGCVLGFEPEDARAAVQNGLAWDDRHYVVRAKLAGGRAVEVRTDAERSGPAETWEALASRELVPLEWLGDAGRSFKGEEFWRVEVGGDMEPRVLAYPPTLRSCVTFASDMASVATAEALAREACERLRPWGAGPVERVLWHVALEPHRSVASPAALVAMTRALPKRANEPLLHVVGDRYWRKPWVEYVRWLGSAQRQWSNCADQGQVIPQLDASYDSVASPFEPLLGLFALGYGLSCFERGTLELVAREV